MVTLIHYTCFIFLLKNADVMAPGLSVVFRRLVRLGSFPPCWRQANVTRISKGLPSSSVANTRPISITCVLSQVSVCLCRFMEAMVCFQPPSLLIGKVWVPVMHFCACPIHCKVHWRVGGWLGSCSAATASAGFTRCPGRTSVYL